VVDFSFVIVVSLHYLWTWVISASIFVSLCIICVLVRLRTRYSNNFLLLADLFDFGVDIRITYRFWMTYIILETSISISWLTINTINRNTLRHQPAQPSIRAQLKISITQSPLPLISGYPIAI